MSKVVTVFGATGFVGSAVARSLSKQYHVRGVTRDPNNAKAQALKAEGIQVVYADQSDQRSLQDAINGSHTCFIQTNFYPDGYQAEMTQGKLIADACARANVKHVVYCTQLSVVKVNGMAAKHMDAKAEIEQYMKDVGLPLTSLIIPIHYESLLIAPLRPNLTENKYYGFEIPMGQATLNMICTEDVGEIVAQIVHNPRTYTNRTLSVCGDKVTVKDIAATFTKILEPYVFKDNQVTVEQFRKSGYPGADDLANMFDFYVRVDQKASIDITLRLNPSLQTLEQWLRTHTDTVLAALASAPTPGTPVSPPGAL